MWMISHPLALEYFPFRQFSRLSQRKKNMENSYIYFVHTCQFWLLLAWASRRVINDWGYAMGEKCKALPPFCF